MSRDTSRVSIAFREQIWDSHVAPEPMPHNVNEFCSSFAIRSLGSENANFWSTLFKRFQDRKSSLHVSMVGADSSKAVCGPAFRNALIREHSTYIF